MIRHHPSLKDRVFDAIKGTLEEIETLGKAYVIPDDIKHWYRIQQVPPPNPEILDSDIPMDTAEQGSGSVLATGSGRPITAPEEETPQKSHDNVITSYIDAFCKVILLLAQSLTYC